MITKHVDDLPKALGQPAHRALAGAGIHALADVCRFTREEIGRLHGIGPKALGVLDGALQGKNLSYARPSDTTDPRQNQLPEGLKQPTRDQDLIFSAVRDLLKTYSPPLVAKVDESGRYDLVSIKDVVIAGRKRKEVYFASVIIQKSYVGFYYMPIYSRA